MTDAEAVPQPIPHPTPHRALLVAIGLGLALAVGAIFGRSAWEDFQFIRYDDHKYVTENQFVRDGISAANVAAVFRPDTIVVANWHPVTLLSHMADCQIFGLNARGHHLAGVLWHAANTVLLFALLTRMTGAVWRSALVAALFGWHPLHVESVGWISERKDLLSTFFWFWMLWAYTSYVRRPNGWRWLAVAGWMVLGLLSKPMLVTAPFLLLLLDFWPLRRSNPLRWRVLLLEKAPLVSLVIGFCAITLGAQAKARMSPDLVPLEARLNNSLQSYVAYVYQTVWPVKLAIPYLLSAREITAARGLACFGLLAAASGLCVAGARRFPYLPVGWFWYLGTLVPAIGIVQVGVQAMADRYTYVPLIGLFIIVAWGLNDLVHAWPRLRPAVVAGLVVWLALLGVGAYRQLGFWRDKATLFGHTVAVQPRNHVAYLYLEAALRERGQPLEALAAIDRAIELTPQDYRAHIRKGVALYRLGRHREAALSFAAGARQERSSMKPTLEFAAAVLAARILATHPDESSRAPATAVEMAEKACSLAGYRNAGALDVLGMAYANVGRFDLAIHNAKQAQRLYREGGLPEAAADVAARLEGYDKKQPYREPPPADLDLPLPASDD